MYFSFQRLERKNVKLFIWTRMCVVFQNIIEVIDKINYHMVNSWKLKKRKEKEKQIDKNKGKLTE